MAIKIGDNLDYKGKKFLASRDSVEKKAYLAQLDTNYYPVGYRVFCEEDQKYYQLKHEAAPGSTTGAWEQVDEKALQALPFQGFTSNVDNVISEKAPSVGYIVYCELQMRFLMAVPNKDNTGYLWYDDWYNRDLYQVGGRIRDNVIYSVNNTQYSSQGGALVAYVRSSKVTNIVVLTKEKLEELEERDPQTFYCVVEG